uniref:Uncharacterized protein n=1 Tax=Rhizophora mucronata TaxID=61149 RepID=A0A2P2N5W7_RHIMU
MSFILHGVQNPLPGLVLIYFVKIRGTSQAVKTFKQCKWAENWPITIIEINFYAS